MDIVPRGILLHAVGRNPRPVFLRYEMESAFPSHMGDNLMRRRAIFHAHGECSMWRLEERFGFFTSRPDVAGFFHFSLWERLHRALCMGHCTCYWGEDEWDVNPVWGEWM